MSINLAGRIPQIKRPFSDRVLWLGIVLAVLLVGAVVYGFDRRIRLKRAHTEQQQVQSVGVDAATSNRNQVEDHALHGLPVVSSPSSRPVAPQATPAAPPSLGVPTNLRPLYARGTRVSRQEMQEGVEASVLGRRRQREQDAMDAPTGASDDHSSGSGVAGSKGLLRPASILSGESLPESGTALPSPLQSLNGLGSAQGYRTQNGQDEKRRFAEVREGGQDDYLSTTRTAPVSRWVIQRGTVIPASLPSKLVSDLPGDLIAEVVRDVYDSPTQRYVEIPAGSRLVGEYNSSVTYGQNRVQVVWNAVYFPDGSFIDLDRMPSHAADGGVGLKDQTDNHLKRLIGGVALSSLLAAGLQISQNRTNGSVLTYPSTSQEAAAAIGTQASELGQQLASRNLNVQPTLKIRPGEIFAVSVKKDIVFPGPYQPIEVK